MRSPAAAARPALAQGRYTSARGAVRLQRRGSLVIGLVSVIGLAAFTWPLFVSAHAGANTAHSADAPWIMVTVLPLLLVAVLSEFNAGGIDAKGVAMLGVLAACGTALRLPSGGTAGFEPVFFLLFPAGYVLGRHFGFLLGALTLFGSALVTAGVGPWLPFQMLAAAWMGYGAGLLPDRRGRRSEVWILAAYATVACLAYGLLLDLWFWPFIGGETTLAFEAGASFWHNLMRFLVFHFSTSLGFDIPRAVVNATLVLIAGKPVIAAFRRASRRAAFDATVTIDPVRELV
jgi:energy-coupling factor transport system substrate-specific component